MQVHGSLLGLVNIAFGLTVRRALGGRAIAFLYGSDPGFGAFLAPIGAVAALVAAALTALPAAAEEGVQQKKKRQR